MRKKIVGLLIFSVAVLLITELALRLFHKNLNTNYAHNIYYDSTTGYSGPAEGVMSYGKLKVTYKDHTRSLSWPSAAQAHILFLGDSFTEAISMNDEDTFAFLATKEINQRQKIQFAPKIRAFGDWSTVQEALAYEKHAQNEKILVLQIFGLNDLINSAVSFAGRYQSELDFFRPYLSANDEVIYASSWRGWLRSRSRLFFEIEKSLLSYKLHHLVAKVDSCEPNSLLPVSVFTKVPAKEWQPAWTALRMGLRRIKKVAEQQGTKILAIYFPSNIEVVHQFWQNNVLSRQSQCNWSIDLDRWGVEQGILQVLKEEGIAAESLRPAYEAARDRGVMLFIPNDGHLTEVGHQITARAIAHRVVKELAKQ